MGNLEKNAGNRGHNIIFFPLLFKLLHLKSTKIQLGENIWYFFSQCLYFFPLRPCNNFSTLTDCVLGEKYCKREIKSYFSRWTQSFLWQYLSWVFQLGENIWYFPPCLYISPCVFIFPPVSSFFPLCLHFFPPRPCN